MMRDWQIDRNCTVANLDWIWAIFCYEFWFILNACELDCLKSGPGPPGLDTKGPGLGPDAADPSGKPFFSIGELKYSRQL